jgi:hypothetical protein
MGLSVSRELLEETALADPRFARHFDRTRFTWIEFVEHPHERAELARTSDEVVAGQAHTCRYPGSAAEDRGEGPADSGTVGRPRPRPVQGPGSG